MRSVFGKAATPARKSPTLPQDKRSWWVGMSREGLQKACAERFLNASRDAE